MPDALPYMICVANLEINVANLSSTRICNFEMKKRNEFSSRFNINSFFKNQVDWARTHI